MNRKRRKTIDKGDSYGKCIALPALCAALPK